MDTIKIGKPLKQLIGLCFNANQPLLLIGAHGVGKSEALEQAAKEMGIGFVCRDLSLMEPPDLIGLPERVNGKTVYAPPQFLPEDGSGLLVFEELNRCERYMRQPCLQLLTARTLNDYTLPPGWLPVAAINPDDGDYQTDQLDPALLSRFVQVNVVADQREWLHWARGNGVHRGVIDYVESDSGIFGEAHSNPRTWTKVSAVLKAAEGSPDLMASLRAAVYGLVGDVRGSAFLAQLKAGPGGPLTAEEVFEEYDLHRARVRGWNRDGRLDMIEASLMSVLLYLQPEDMYRHVRYDSQQWERLEHFLSDLPGDFATMAKEDFDERGYDFPVVRRPGRAKRGAFV